MTHKDNSPPIARHRNAWDPAAPIHDIPMQGGGGGGGGGG